ncbi:putative metal-dependent hydrolase [Fulvivirga maritima]|uniref:YfiT family bacillithiol transferase n=1 Tax=Fulvivirga maritima TaxID=2904247 RepID=UPI001F348A62|nr:putative metal-dependent hydrolase [Fulvivirga maritima]UII26055.1 putative metal-dependent hydrolase [Fulvivirga maritima]
MDQASLQYPIGKFNESAPKQGAEISGWIQQIEMLPEKLKQAVEGLNDAQLDTPYRPGGWTLRQVVHHIGDSHLNSYIRFKWTLTEDEPIIKAYNEKAWAELFDSEEGPIELTLNFIEALHKKWVYLLRGLKEDELNKFFVHPDNNNKVTLKLAIGMYAWHGNHHLAHISNLTTSKGWK